MPLYMPFRQRLAPVAIFLFNAAPISNIPTKLLRGEILPDRNLQADRQAIRDLIESWALWRDAGDWDRLGTLWHKQSRMVATWFEASGQDFVARSRAAWDSPTQVLHSLGGISVEIAENRAVAETRMLITQRATVHGVIVDVECKGRFWDALIKENGEWQLVLRQPIYEMDRMSPVDPSVRLELDKALLAQFPEGYRNLAYLQTQLGLKLNLALPGARGAKVNALRDKGRRWLTGLSVPDLLSAHAELSSAA